MPDDIFKNKIKTICCNYFFSLDSVYFNIEYDSSTLKLKRVYNNNRLFFQINQRTTEFIEFEYKTSLGYDSLQENSSIILKVFLNQNGLISRIAYIDTTSLNEINIAYFYSTNAVPDSIRGVNTSIYSDIIKQDFVIVNENIESYNYSYNNLILGMDNYLPTSFIYSSLLTSENWMPFQNSYDISYYYSFSRLGFDPVYFLGLDNIFPFKPNKNLVSKQKVNDGVSINNENNYNYTLNNKGLVEEMNILSSPSNTNLLCKFEYY